MKKIAKYAMFFSALSLGFMSCDGNEPTEPTPVADNVLSGLIEEDMTLTKDIIWELNGRVIVTNNATLTIEPGTIIKGRDGIGANASVLMIAADGMIDAEGTAAEPIIFTSISDNIELGQKFGTNLTQNDAQEWGGVVILGKAPISPDAGTVAQIEGVPASQALGQYGGSEATHNSGILKYVSIRHGGQTIDAAAGNDINGLTLGGVGSGTTISYIEIFANFDDGIEFFGGTVNASNLLVYTVGDDAIDVDQAYAGTISNFRVYTSAAASSDEALEIDGPEGAENAEGKFTISTGTITSVDGGGFAGDFKSKAQGTVSNVSWSGFDAGNDLVKIRASYNDADCSTKTDSYSNLVAGDLAFTNVAVEGVEVYTASEACTVSTEAQLAAEAEINVGVASGFSIAAFSFWTISSNLELL